MREPSHATTSSLDRLARMVARTGESRLERFVAVGGVGLALTTTLFAGTMIVTHQGRTELTHDFPAMVAGFGRTPDPRVDYTPTGSVSASTDRDAMPGAAWIIPYRLRASDGRAATVEGPPGRVVTVAPGDMLPTAGRVVAIERGGGGWVLVTTQRRIE